MDKFERLYIALLSECLHARAGDPSLPFLAAAVIDDEHSDEALISLAALSEQSSSTEVENAARDLLRHNGVALDFGTSDEVKLVRELLRLMACDPSSVEEISATLRKIGSDNRNWAFLPKLGKLIGLAYTWDEPWAGELPGLMSTEATRILEAGLD